MTREQLDLLMEYIDAKVFFWLQAHPATASARELARKRDALYATIETHTPLEALPDAELYGQEDK